MVKVKICKCGHKRESHTKRWLTYEDCTKCKCSDYLRREKPDLSDKFLNIIIIGSLIVLWILPIYMYYEFSLIETEEVLEIDFSDFAHIMIILFVVIVLLWTGIMFPFDYFRHKNRTVYKIEDE